jgi:homoserine kinase
VPQELRVVLVRPHREIETRQARAALPSHIPLALHVEQTMHLCGFVAGCFRGELGAIGRSMVDLVAEPARAPLIPGFDRARELAHAGGALGFSIAGSGPSVFAWVATESAAKRVESDVRRCFAEHGSDSDSWVGPISSQGARLV